MGDPEEYPCFEITDLSKDSRFANLPVIDGRIAAMRFYAGTPITTKHGINIGSFFMFDNQPRPNGLTLEQRKTMFTTAANIMKHLESKREAVERRRIALMSGGVARFLDKANELTDLSTSTAAAPGAAPDADGTPSEKPPALSMSNSTDKSDEDKNVVSHDSMVSKSNDGFEDGHVKRGASEIVLDKIKIVLDQAASILRESLELRDGGCVFFDTALRYPADPQSCVEENDGSYFKVPNANGEWEVAPAALSDDEEPTMTGVDPKMTISPGQMRGYDDERRPARVLAMSVAKGSYERSAMLSTKTLTHFVNEYPKGNIWYIDESGYFSSLDQISTNPNPDTGKSGFFGRRKSVDIATPNATRREEEGILLRLAFPKCRQVIFLPLFDSRQNRWHSGSFVYSNNAFPVFTIESELSYISALANSVMVEVSRLDVLRSDAIKQDFISSISHEFRSPLHGILASAEFLYDFNLDQTQRELVSTIQTCGSTLLDTINHVLDFSKINNFEKKGPTGAFSNELDTASNVALLCEDIVQGVVAGQSWSNIEDGNPMRRDSEVHHVDSPVEIVLDFSENMDWKFRVQPGAIKRIILNLVGNSLKYTPSGFILVQLRVKNKAGRANPMALKPNHRILTLNVIDSGKGMSPEFMSRNLFKPFSQQDSLMQGVGLGMAIVKSIVSQLGGRINVRSELGKGTDVEVLLPLEVPGLDWQAQKQEPEHARHRHSAATADVEAVKAVDTVRGFAHDKMVAIWRRADAPRDRNKDLAWKSVQGYCKAWFGFTVLEGQDPETLAKADLVIKEWTELDDDPSTTTDGMLKATRLLILEHGVGGIGTGRSRFEARATTKISMPVGPFKLARSILSLFSDQHPMQALDGDGDNIGPLDRIDGQVIDEGIYPMNAIEDRTAGAKTIKSDDNERVYDYVGAQDALRNLEHAMDAHALNIGMPPERPHSAMAEPKLKRPHGHAQTDSLPAIPTISSLAPQPQETEQRPLHILAVDDNNVNLMLLTRYLKKRSMDTVVTARNGVEAVSAVHRVHEQGRNFDLVFMDISMPIMDGFEATRLIRKFEKSQRTKALAETLQLPRSITRILSEDNVRSILDAELDVLLYPESTIKIPTRGLTGRPVGHVIIGQNAIVEENVRKKIAEIEESNSYIVALTGLASRRDRDEAVTSGFDDFMTKPISFGMIGDLLGRMSTSKERCRGRLGDVGDDD